MLIRLVVSLRVVLEELLKHNGGHGPRIGGHNVPVPRIRKRPFLKLIDLFRRMWC